MSTVVESTVCLDMLDELTLAHPLIKNISKLIRYFILIFLSSKNYKVLQHNRAVPGLKSHGITSCFDAIDNIAKEY